MAGIPKTLVKLSQSLGIISAHQVDDGIIPTSLDPVAIAEFALSTRTIGATYGFKLNQSRTNIKRHGIDSPIEAFAIAPGTTSYTLELQMSVLYIQDALQAFDFAGGSIVNQTRPLIIHEITTPPNVDFTAVLPKFTQKGDLGKVLSAATKVSNIHTYLGCWFNSSNVEYTLSGNQAVLQNVMFDVARVINPNIVETAATLGQRSLAKKVGLLPSAVRTAGSTLGI